MKVSIIKGNLVIEIPMESERLPSTSGKTLCVASSHGNQKTGVKCPITGTEIVVGFNAYVKK